MSAKAIREYDGKQLLNFWLPKLNIDHSMTGIYIYIHILGGEGGEGRRK